MKVSIAMMISMFCEGVIAASAYWSGVHVINGGVDYDDVGLCYLSGMVRDNEGKSAEINSSFFWHNENENLYLKHKDFSLEDIEPTFNWWAFAAYGDIVSEETFNSLNHIEDFYSNDFYTGGTLVENPDDFYMTFKVSEVLLDGSDYVAGQTWYGWVHVSIGENLEMTLLGEGINLSGGAVTVGAIPEPSSALLLLAGGALLALRRRSSAKLMNGRGPTQTSTRSCRST